jgi:hypothetical protein
MQTTLWCTCGRDRETVIHLLTKCGELADYRLRLQWRLVDGREVRVALVDKSKARQIVEWLLESGRLREYQLAIELDKARGNKSAGTISEKGELEQEVELRRRITLVVTVRADSVLYVDSFTEYNESLKADGRE